MKKVITFHRNKQTNKQTDKQTNNNKHTNKQQERNKQKPKQIKQTNEEGVDKIDKMLNDQLIFNCSIRPKRDDDRIMMKWTD